FSFTGDAAGTINDGQTITTSDLVPGTYTSVEAAKTGWDLSTLSCDDSNSTGNTSTRTATFHLEAGETVTCTFNNKSRASLTINKQDDAGNPLDGVVFTLYVDNAPLDGNPPHGAGDTITTKTCTTVAGTCSISDILPGQYWVVETTGKV